jgi:predicted Rossmann fold flavoprotein
MMAAAQAAGRGKRTLLLEKNRKPGIKILLSGGTRCNFTHAADARGIVEAFGPSGRFLHSALAAFGPQEIIDLMQSEGVPAKIESGTGKVFPASDRASDVLAVLLRRLKKSGSALDCAEPLQNIEPWKKGFRLITARRTIFAEKVLLATGGQSYPACGTTGDGYRWAAELGHNVIPPRTALVPVTTHAPWITALQGITIPDVLVKVIEPAHNSPGENRAWASRRGSFLFTHFGLSGPAVLDVSRVISAYLQPQKLILQCDFLPDIKPEKLAALIEAECATAGQRQMAVILQRWLPRRLAETVLEQAAASLHCRGAEFSKSQRRRLINTIKQLAIPVAGTTGFRKAEVTAGGVSLQEVDSRRMQSKIVPGLYFAGELLDLDGPIGGYNFQAAFSTGYLAGKSM